MPVFSNTLIIVQNGQSIIVQGQLSIGNALMFHVVNHGGKHQCQQQQWMMTQAKRGRWTFSITATRVTHVVAMWRGSPPHCPEPRCVLPFSFLGQLALFPIAFPTKE
jgi:hypothetical protein